MKASEPADWEAGWTAYEAAGGAWQPSCMVFPRDRPLERPGDLPEALVRRLEEPTAEGTRWLFEALKDPERKYFVAVLAEYARPLEGRFFTALLDAAVDEVNPSWNRAFIDPCLRAFGQRRVLLYLLRVIDRGANDQKAGAINALYWAGDEAWSFEDASDLRERQAELLLRTFVSNPDLDVRRSIIPRLHLRARDYPARLRPLVAEAVAIAQAHEDAYVRHRVAAKLGADEPVNGLRVLQALPYRGDPLRSERAAHPSSSAPPVDPREYAEPEPSRVHRFLRGMMWLFRGDASPP